MTPRGSRSMMSADREAVESPLTMAAALAGIGLLAGIAGTIAITLSQKIEMAIDDREPSDSPAKAVEAVTGVEPENDRQEQRLSTATHWAYGSALGLGLSAMARVPEPARGALFFAGVWGGGAALLARLGLADPPTRWSGKQLAIDLAHHVVYAATAAAAFAGLRQAARI